MEIKGEGMTRFYCAAIYLEEWCVPLVLASYHTPEHFVEDILKQMSDLHARHGYRLAFSMWSRDAERIFDVVARPPKDTLRHVCSIKNQTLLRDLLLSRARRLFAQEIL